MKKLKLGLVLLLTLNCLITICYGQDDVNEIISKDAEGKEDVVVTVDKLVGSWIGSETTYQFDKDGVIIITPNGSVKSTWEIDEANGIIRLGDDVPVKIFLSENSKVLTFEYDSKDRYYESNYYEELMVNIKKTEDGEILLITDDFDNISYFSKTWKAPKEGPNVIPVFQFKENGTFEEWNFVGFPFESVFDYRKNEESGTWTFNNTSRTLKLKYYKGKGNPNKSNSFQITRITQNVFYINGNTTISGRYEVCKEK